MGESRSRVRRVLRAFGLTVVVVALLAAMVVGWALLQVRRSLPPLDGDFAMTGLTAPVTIERDGLGVPTVTGATREDVARGLGFAHGQDRFFQMDLARRRAAGELAALVGASALRLDRQARLFGFRALARLAVEAAPAADRRLLEAYAAGVNAGLASLAAVPPEYLVLRSTPEPWRPEDSALVIASMFLMLQDSTAARERRVALVHEVLPGPLADFLTTTASDWDTPLVGAARRPPPLPGPDVLDLRRLPKAARRAQQPDEPGPLPQTDMLDLWGTPGMAASNNWAVSGRLARDGGALLANDMHLAIGAPNIWYRASLVWGSGPPWRVTGVTLPGLPTVVVGSNGHLAWGFTNTTADWSDLVRLEIDPVDASRYREGDGWRRFTVRREEIRVARQASEFLEVRDTIWGPVTDPDARGRPLALCWVPLRTGGLNLEVAGIETARTIEEALAATARGGIPAQNLVLAQRDGRIAWSVAGRIPRRVGFDGALPVSWADGSRGWDGWLRPEEYPRLVDPPSGRIVTANNRLVDGDALRALGDGGYDPGARMRQILDGLQQVAAATPADMLRVQLDDRAVFLERWRQVLLDTLTVPAMTGSADRRELRRVVERQWTGHAQPDDAAYRLVRDFRQAVAEIVFGALLAPVREIDPSFPLVTGRGGEGPLWSLVSQRPPHLLPADYGGWTDLLLAAADRVIAGARSASGRLDAHTWGRFNTPRLQHPLSRALPSLGWLLDLPRAPLPGDSHMPRVQVQDFGASQRMAVSPGREQDGYLHMPGGQSGHPFSKHYRDGHAAWVSGEPTPLLPGRAVHTITLR